jgi:hypothetical protein
MYDEVTHIGYIILMLVVNISGSIQYKHVHVYVLRQRTVRTLDLSRLATHICQYRDRALELVHQYMFV